MCNSRKLSVAEALCRNFKHMLAFLLALLLLMEGTAWNSYADEIINPSDSQTESQAQPTPAPTVKPIKPPASEENTEPIQEPDAPSGHDADTTTSDHTNTSDIQEPSSPTPSIADISSPEVTDTAAPDPSPAPSPTPSAEIGPVQTASPSQEPVEELDDVSTPEPTAFDAERPEESAASTSPENAASPDITPVPDEPTKGDQSGLVIVNVRPERVKDWSGVVEYGKGGMAIPQLFQFNYRTTICRYDGIPRSVSTSGCNVTCLSMVIAYLTGDSVQNPQVLFKWAVKNGLYHGDGLGHDQMSKIAAQYDVASEWIGRDGDAVVAALKNGIPVIAHMGPGLFTEYGHYIVLRGVTENGKILVNDPNSRSNSSRAFPLRTILREAKTSEPFMLCLKDARA